MGWSFVAMAKCFPCRRKQNWHIIANELEGVCLKRAVDSQDKDSR
jgi:hypothetical protein